MKHLLSAILILVAAFAGAQTFTGTETPSAVPISGPLRSVWVPEAGDVKMLDVDDLDGAFVKTLTEASGTVSVTYQAGDNSADTLTFTVGTGGGGLDEAAVDARVNVVAADACVEIDYAGSTLTCTQLDGGTDTVTISTTGTTDGVVDGGSVSGDTLTLTRTESLADVTIQTGFATDAEVDGVFDSALFSNLTRDLVFGHYGSGTSTIPLDFLNSTNDARPAAITNVTVEQGDTVIVDSGVYMFTGSVRLTVAKTAIPSHAEFDQIDGEADDGVVEAVDLGVSGGNLTVTLERSVGADITDTVALPAGGGGGNADGVADSLDFTASAQTLSIAIGLSIGNDLTDSLFLTEGNIPSLSAGKTTSGTFDAARIPDSFATDAEVADGALQPADITEGANITITRAGDAVTIATSGGGTDDQTAAEVTVDTTDFAGNLGSGDDSVQEALDTLDDLSVGGGSGVSVDGVDVQYVTNSRSVFVSVQQDDGNDFSDSANIPRGSLTVPGLFEIATAAEVTAGTETDAALTPANMADITGEIVTDATLNVSTPANESTNIAASRQAVAEAVASAGRALATGEPQPVAAVADTGTGTRAAHGSHIHALGIGDTLQFNADDELSVSITEVIEHLSQQIRYFTSDGADYSTGGSAAGQVYTTNAYPKNLFKVQAQIRPSTGSIYRAGVYEVDDDNEITAILGESDDSAELAADQTHLVKFDLSVVGGTDLGIPLDGDERIAVLIRRVGDGSDADTHVRSGGEAASSPSVSYADARNDFVLVNHVIYRHEDPAVGNTTHSHGTSIRGNLRLYYSVTIDHGSLIGSGNVNAAHIDSGAALATEFLRADGSQGALWAVPPGGGGGTAFHLYDDVTNQLAAGGLAADDRLLLADVSHTSNRNVYAILGDVHQSFYATIASTAHAFTGAPADDDLIAMSGIPAVAQKPGCAACRGTTLRRRWKWTP